MRSFLLLSHLSGSLQLVIGFQARSDLFAARLDDLVVIELLVEVFNLGNAFLEVVVFDVVTLHAYGVVMIDQAFAS